MLIFISILYLHFIFHLHFADVLHWSMFFIHICLSTSCLTHPWTIVEFLHPFYTFSPAHRSVIRNTSIFNHSVIFLLRALRFLGGAIIFLPWALRFWEGIFYPQAFFTLRSFTDILTRIYQDLRGNRQFFVIRTIQF